MVLAKTLMVMIWFYTRKDRVNNYGIGMTMGFNTGME